MKVTLYNDEFEVDHELDIRNPSTDDPQVIVVVESNKTYILGAVKHEAVVGGKEVERQYFQTDALYVSFGKKEEESTDEG